MTIEIREEERVAVASIRGYWYQLLHTVRAWLRAGDNELIVAEGNEDIDHILLTTPRQVIEEQIKFRKVTLTQGSRAVVETTLHYLEAFVHHRALGRQFRGLLRTNAMVSDDDTTQVGKWLLRKRLNIREFRKELRELVRANGEEQLQAFRALKTDDEFRAFTDSVEWAPNAGNTDELEGEIAQLVQARAPHDGLGDGAKNALFVHMLKTMTSDDVDRRTLRRIDADLVLNDSILDALERSGAAEREKEWRVTLWTRSAVPSVAVALFIDDEQHLEHALDFARRSDDARGKTRSDGEILGELAERLDFVAYVSFRRLKGKHRVRDCLRDVVRQSRHRHTPAEVWLPEGSPDWVDSLVTPHWPTPLRVGLADKPAALLRLAELIGAAIPDEIPRQEILRALGTKLRWVRCIDDGAYFTAERPIVNGPNFPS